MVEEQVDFGTEDSRHQQGIDEGAAEQRMEPRSLVQSSEAPDSQASAVSVNTRRAAYLRVGVGEVEGGIWRQMVSENLRCRAAFSLR